MDSISLESMRVRGVEGDFLEFTTELGLTLFFVVFVGAEFFCTFYSPEMVIMKTFLVNDSSYKDAN